MDLDMIIERFQEVITENWHRVSEPLRNFSHGYGDRWFFGYLLVSLLFAFLIVTYRNRDPEKSWQENLRITAQKLFDRRVLLHRSSLLDYRYAFVNHIFSACILVYLITAVGVFSTLFFNLFSQFTLFEGVGLEMGWAGFALTIFIYAFGYDTSNFFQHYLQHKVPILWEFHKVHHSAEVLTPVTAVRLHPVPQLIAATISAMVFGCLNGLGFNLFSGRAAEYSLLGANLFALLYYTVGLYHLKHSHVWVRYPNWIKEVFASPCLHLIHHSDNVRHYDKNFGFVFTFWDRIFGTYYDPKEEEQHELVYGISKSEGRDEYSTVRQLYLTPFRRAWELHLKPRPKARNPITEEAAPQD